MLTCIFPVKDDPFASDIIINQGPEAASPWLTGSPDLLRLAILHIRKTNLLMKLYEIGSKIDQWVKNTGLSCI